MSVICNSRCGAPVILTVGPEVAVLAIAESSAPYVPLNTVCAAALADPKVIVSVDWNMVGFVVAAVAVLEAIPESVYPEKTRVGATVAPLAETDAETVTDPNTTDGATVAPLAAAVEDHITTVGPEVAAGAEAISGCAIVKLPRVTDGPEVAVSAVAGG